MERQGILRTLVLGLALGLLVLGLVGASLAPANAQSPEILVMRVDGTIVPAVADYLDRGLTEAESREVAAVIIELDTPGGLLNATKDIVDRILRARVPVVVYVAPAGAWAASAGTFITMAADVAAMAPGTFIGAAHPVSGEGGEIPAAVEEKVIEATVAWARSVAEAQGHNPDFAESSIRESKSATADEALELGVIDLRADSLAALISQLDGRTVRVGEQEVIIQTTGYVLRPVSMTFFERFLHAISDPNIAYILLSLGTAALFLELANPGGIFPGVVGVISLLLAFYSLSVLQAYYVGIVLIMLAFVLFVLEVFMTSYGMLTIGGIASLAIGSIVLFSGASPIFNVNVSMWVIVGVVSGITAFFLFVVSAVVRSHRRQVTTGAQGLVGMTGITLSKLDPQGMILVDGERWTARAEDGSIERAQPVEVVRVEGLKLWVRKGELIKMDKLKEPFHKLKKGKQEG